MLPQYVTFVGPREHLIYVEQRNQVIMSLYAWLGAIPQQYSFNYSGPVDRASSFYLATLTSLSPRSLCEMDSVMCWVDINFRNLDTQL